MTQPTTTKMQKPDMPFAGPAVPSVAVLELLSHPSSLDDGKWHLAGLQGECRRWSYAMSPMIVKALRQDVEDGNCVSCCGWVDREAGLYGWFVKKSKQPV
jgi:hypothetical protein